MRSQSGFTLLEMVVVVLVMGMAAAIVFPRLPDLADSRLNNAGRSCSSHVCTVMEAVATSQQPLVLRVSLGEGIVSVLVPADSGDLALSTDPALAPLRLPVGVLLQDVVSTNGEKYATGSVDIPIAAGGPARPLILHLRSSEKMLTVTIYPTLRSRIEAGYVEVAL